MTDASRLTVQLFGFDIDATPEPGRVIRMDNWRLTTTLTACEVPELAAFRVLTPNTQQNLAVNVTVTGRKPVKTAYSDAHWVRIKIEFVGDGEPSTFHGGYMKIRD